MSILPPPKRAYKTPRMKTVGSVQKLTLKSGSNTDSFGGTFG
ncbi:hypothetical protein [Spirosoma areae]